MKDSKYIDHTLLKATATREQIVNLCAEANKYDFKSVCVNPYWVSFAHELLGGSDVLVCTVIGFPLGANTKDVKAYETTRAIADGADEVDMVINVGEAKAHNWNYVYEDIKAVVDAARAKNIPIRVGVNSGSLEKELIEKYGGVPAEGLVESALDKVKIIEDLGYDNLVISIKSSDVMMCVKAHELIVKQTNHPLHVGITESGTLFSGSIKSSIGLGLILGQGIGDTIRVSLTDDPVKEIEAAKLILRTLGLRKGGIEVVSCPTCGRTKIDLIGLASKVEELVRNYDLDIKIAVMGCVVNGPGEAKEADIGIAGGDGCGVLIKHGEIIKKFEEDKLLAVLKDELDNWKD